MRDILSVAVIEKGGTPLPRRGTPGANQAFYGLRPTRVGHIRIDIGFKIVFGRLECIPERSRLMIDELNLNN